jgi:hypothetical protein
MAATSQFGEGFSLRAFLNAQLASVRVGDEQQVAELLRGLEERAAIVRDEADAATRDLVKVVAPCTRELTRTHAEVRLRARQRAAGRACLMRVAGGRCS